MKIGLVYELQDEQNIEATAEFASAFEVDNLAGTLAALGHGVQRIGDIAGLVRALAGGQTFDLVFNYAAGRWGSAREAQAPALLEALQIPYTGADAFTLTLCIDKAVVKRLWRLSGLPTPDFHLVAELRDLASLPRSLRQGFPLFVKPAREGSSKGISPDSVVVTAEALAARAAALLAAYRQPVLVESYLPGREFSVGLLGSGDTAEVLGVVEIQHAGQDLVDLAGKKSWSPQTFSPVADAGLRHELCDLGWRAYRAVDCRAIGRVDIRLDRDRRPQLLEINPNPGLHPTRSAMPALGMQAGLAYPDLIARLLAQPFASNAPDPLRPVLQERVPLLDRAPSAPMVEPFRPPNVYLKYVEGIRLGVYAARAFDRGDFLFSAAGRVVDEQSEHTIQIGWGRHLDVYPPARYLNHSCDPNAGVKTNAQGYPDFYAMRGIAKDEEVRYDYAMTEYRHYERTSPDQDFDLTCHCGAAACRGRFGYYSELPAALKAAYRGFISDYLV